MFQIKCKLASILLVEVCKGLQTPQNDRMLNINSNNHRYLIESQGSVGQTRFSILPRLATRFNTSNPNKQKPGYNLQRFCFLYLARLCRDPLEIACHQQ